MPRCAAVFDKNCLRRLMPHIEVFGNRVREAAVFDHKNDSAEQFARRAGESLELLVDVGADRALRAMLENENRIGFRLLENLFQISILA